MNEVATTTPLSDEADVLAAELVNSFGRLVQLYERHFSLTPEEATRRASVPLPVRLSAEKAERNWGILPR